MTRHKNVAVGRIGMPAFATASRSDSVARSAWTIQSTPASAAARVEPAPREWIATRSFRRCASAATAAISSLASICVVPERLSAILMKLTPCLSWRRTSATISAALLHKVPIEWSGVPTQDGSSSSMQP